jgi:hypothetical protein
MHWIAACPTLDAGRPVPDNGDGFAGLDDLLRDRERLARELLRFTECHG